jgi:hypothetical protein
MANEIFNSNIIDIGKSAERAKWCKILNCLEKDLIDAVVMIGPAANIVDDFLVLNRKKLN